MARADRRRPENAPGGLFVDATCIDCDTCRWMAPATFARRGGQSAVVQQPTDAAQRRAAHLAVVACPTASIGSDDAAAVRDAAQAFPIPVAGAVYDCGYHSADSFGATSYLIVRPEGNVMVDSPRFAEPLARRIEAMGGIGLLVLTHRDDVADHARFAERFGCRRLVHERDAGPWAQGVETFGGVDAVDLGGGLTAIPTPGHTAGHACYLWQDPSGQGMLFTGDHLAFDAVSGELEAWPDVCWFDWRAQTESMERLSAYEFARVLPGHGRGGVLAAAQMTAALRRLVTWMQAQ